MSKILTSKEVAAMVERARRPIRDAAYAASRTDLPALAAEAERDTLAAKLADVTAFRRADGAEVRRTDEGTWTAGRMVNGVYRFISHPEASWDCTWPTADEAFAALPVKP